MNRIIKKLSFKKIIVVYLVLLIAVVAGAGAFLGRIYRGKIELLYDYYKISESFDKRHSLQDIEKKLTDLCNKSADITDAAVAEKNGIVFSVGNLYNAEWRRVGGTDFFADGNGKVYKLLNKEKFVLSIFGINEDDEKDYCDGFLISDSGVLNYLKNNDEKIIITGKIQPVKNGRLYLKAVLSILLLMFMLYWIITAMIIYRDALIMKFNAYAWGLIVLFTNLFGVILYLFYRHGKVSCLECGGGNAAENAYCVYCGARLDTRCPKCGVHIGKSDNYCKGCGEKL